MNNTFNYLILNEQSKDGNIKNNKINLIFPATLELGLKLYKSHMGVALMGLIVWSVLNAIITAGRRCCNHLNEKYLGQRIKPWTDYGEESDLSEEFALKRDTALYRMIKSESTLKNI